jgi:hypothetical protein
MITASYEGRASSQITMPVAAASAGVFTRNQTGAGQLAAVNAVDGSRNTAASPVKLGGFISLHAAGEGQSTPAGSEGKIASASSSVRPAVCSPDSARISARSPSLAPRTSRSELTRLADRPIPGVTGLLPTGIHSPLPPRHARHEIASSGSRRKRSDRGTGPQEFKSQHPFTSNSPIADLRWRKLPSACGRQGQVGEILTRPSRIERRAGDAAGRVHQDSNADPHLSSDGVAYLWGHRRQDLFHDFPGDRSLL